MLIIGLLSRRHGSKTENSPDVPLRLGRVLSRMEQAPSESLSLAELAREAAMSECTFLRKFREATGFSPTDYLLRSRIRRAEELLARRKLSITEVAARCGFEDSNYFSRQFRRVTGVSPRAHRRSG
jgi:transcriptional regulator GlxA family with amidase domain